MEYPQYNTQRSDAIHHRGKGPKNYRRTDDRIHEDVCDHLLVDGSVDASDIEVNVSEGVVILEGTVPERHMKRFAEDVAMEIRGVSDVENRLRISRQSEDRRSPVDEAAETPRDS